MFKVRVTNKLNNIYDTVVADSLGYAFKQFEIECLYFKLNFEPTQATKYHDRRGFLSYTECDRFLTRQRKKPRFLTRHYARLAQIRMRKTRKKTKSHKSLQSFLFFSLRQLNWIKSAVREYLHRSQHGGNLLKAELMGRNDFGVLQVPVMCTGTDPNDDTTGKLKNFTNNVYPHMYL